MVYAASGKRTLSKKGRILTGLLAAVLLFVLFFSFYLIFMRGEEFQDELDVFIVGSEVGYGAEMYKDTVSQHMPFSYYLAALITVLFHPNNAYGYRLALYIFLSLLWVAIFLRYKDKVNPVALVLLPPLYIAVLTLYENGSMMLSEHWAGIGHVILLLELMIYPRRKRLDIASDIWISFSILLSFGCVFTSAYSIAIVAVGVFLYQICLIAFTGKAERAALRRTILLDDLRLVGIVLLPWAVLMLWYAVTGNIQNFIYSVYRFNVEVYSEYTGLGTDAWGAFRAILPNFFSYLRTGVDALFRGDFSVDNLAIVSYTVCPLIVAIYLCFVHPIIGFTYLFATAAIAIRGFGNFHALHFMCAATLSTALVAGFGIRLPAKKPKNPVSYVAFIAGVVIFAFFVQTVLPLMRNVPKVFEDDSLFAANEDYRELTDILTVPSDRIHYTDFYTTPIDVGRPIDYGPACSSPWTWTGFGEREMEALDEYQTKIVFYDSGYSVWGYDRDTYAADFVQKLRNDYFPLSRSIYIRRSYLNEAVRRMLKAGYDDYLEFYDATPLSGETPQTALSLRGTQSAGTSAGFTFTPDEDMALELVEFWPQANADQPLSDIVVSVRDAQSGETVAENTAYGAFLVPGEMNLVFFDSLVLSEGTTYDVLLTLPESASGDVLLDVSDAQENDYDATPLLGLEDGQAWRIAIETVDPSFLYSGDDDWDEEWGDYEDYGDEEGYWDDEEYEDYEEDEEYGDFWSSIPLPDLCA